MDAYDQIATNKTFSGCDMVAQALMTSPDGSRHLYTLGTMQTLTYSIHMERRPIRSIGNVNAKDYVMGPRTIAGTLIFTVFNRHFAYETMEAINKSGPQHAFLADELPPFDITISFANEYGAQARLVLYGIRLVNEGQVMSINDIYTENTYQFVATDIEYMNDVAGYSTMSKNRYDRFVESVTSDKDSGSTKDLTKAAKSAPAPTISLDAKMVYPATPSKKGTVRLMLTPKQLTGKIRIKTAGTTIDFDVDEYKGLPIYASLKQGNYEAQYLGTSNSNTALFVVSNLVVPQASSQIVPIIERTTRNKIWIMSNAASHTKVKYAEIDGNPDLVFHEKALVKGHAILDSLREDTRYLVYTTGPSEESVRIYAKTTVYNSEPFDDLREYISYNKSRIPFGELQEYVTLINDAKLIAMASQDDLTVAAALSTLQANIQKTLSGLKLASYNTEAEYNAASQALNRKISIIAVLLGYANRFFNSRVIGGNPSAVVIPPKPEMSDAINCVFVLADNIEKLEFYRQYSKITQFAGEVNKLSFYRNAAGKLAYRFSGKPGLNHYVYAFDKSGQRSIKLGFYVMTDEERATALAKYYVDDAGVRQLLKEASGEYGDDLKDMKLDTESFNRMLVQFAMLPDASVFTTPEIISKSKTSIKVKVDMKGRMEQNDSVFWVAMSEAAEAMLPKPRQKIKVDKATGEVEFTAEKHGLKVGESYAIWIEDDKEAQVSPCVTTTVHEKETDATEAEDNAIAIYLAGKVMASIKANLSNRITITDEIADCIDNLADDASVNYDNAFAKLIYNIDTHSPKISKTYPIIMAIMRAKMDLVYNVNSKFHTGKLVLDKDKSTIELPAGSEVCTVVIEYVRNGVTTFKTIKTVANEKTKVEIKNEGSYATVYSIAPDLRTTSGAVFVDVVSKTFDLYKEEEQTKEEKEEEETTDDSE